MIVSRVGRQLVRLGSLKQDYLKKRGSDKHSNLFYTGNSEALYNIETWIPPVGRMALFSLLQDTDGWGAP